MGDTHLVSIFSDVHIPVHHPGAWAAFRAWHADHTPALSVGLGDLIDLTMLSRYDKNEADPVYATHEIMQAATELNGISEECGRLIVMPGNHEDRWRKAIIKDKAQYLLGAAGLDLESQFRAQGLREDIQWVNESATEPGLVIGKRAAILFHGHRQAKGWGIKNIAAGSLTSFPMTSSVVGHHHRAQMMCRTSLGKTIVAIANPHMAGPQEYNTSPDWQRGFTVLEFYGRSRLRDCEHFTPHVVVMDEFGRFAWNGKVYGSRS